MSEEMKDIIEKALAPLTKVLATAQNQLEQSMILIDKQGKSIDSFTKMTTEVCENIAQAIKDCDDPQVLLALNRIKAALETLRDEVC